MFSDFKYQRLIYLIEVLPFTQMKCVDLMKDGLVK